MKTVQWATLLGVVAVLVFGVAFAVNYLGGRGKGPGPKVAPQVRLTFADRNTRFPAPPEPAALCGASTAGVLSSSPAAGRGCLTWTGVRLGRMTQAVKLWM